jgi:hypothetical protein
MEQNKNSDDVIVYFSEPILSRCGGSCDKACAAMYDNIHYSDGDTWMVESYVELKHRFGVCIFVLHFYNDKSVCIYDYRVKRPNASNLSDVQFLKRTLSELGWLKVFPYHSEVEKSIDFWKSLWETGIVEYEKFDNMYSR